MKNKRSGLFYSQKEETVNSISHGIGFAMGVIVGIVFLIKSYQSGNLPAIFGVWLYLFGMGGSYLASTLYHALNHHNPWKRRLRHWDHAAIYWHIAGSYSPITLVALKDESGWGLFGFVWLCALIGTVVSFRKMKEHSHVETACYILMGLSVLVVFKQLFAISPAACYWIIAEGICYITGAAFYSLHKARYMHSVFHFFVLGGSACHMAAIWKILNLLL
ncbi:hemolysin III family protein [Bacteroides heparinolyticus]|uniref:PAQR family membrane homeostasis protein TrhA n=2 Tax=Prevotella heparinolytica TaxID=28113 RepID=UPI0035A1BF56